MSKQVRVVLNSGEVRRQLLNSSEIKDFVSSSAQKIASRCGDGYGAINVRMPNRDIAIVETQTPRAMRDCQKTNRLLKELHE